MYATPHDLKVCIIGAGMGGLSSALALARAGFKDIEVYEYAKDLGFVGAGIQMPPNMARVLDDLGVWNAIVKDSVVVKEMRVRQGSSDQELACVDLEHVAGKWGFPHVVGHRSTLAGELYKGCQQEPAIRFHFSTSVESINLDQPDKPSFNATPRNGEPRLVQADILLAADGVKSKARTALLSHCNVRDGVEDTGSAAYRIMLTRDQMKADPDLLELISNDKVTRWVGDRRHIIAYPISNGQIYNISTAQPDLNFASAPSTTYTTRGSKSAMLSTYSDFCPTVQKLLNLVPEGEVCEWKLRVHAPLPTWVRGSTALLGDACHPTLPHINQGAAQAIEDSAALALVLSHLPDATPAAVNKALRLYEDIRKERAERMVQIAALNGKMMQLSEGEAKVERDRQFALIKNGQGPVPDRAADAETHAFAYSDCINPARDMVRKVLASH